MARTYSMVNVHKSGVPRNVDIIVQLSMASQLLCSSCVVLDYVKNIKRY